MSVTSAGQSRASRNGALPRRSIPWKAALACAVGTIFGLQAIMLAPFALLIVEIGNQFSWTRATASGAFAVSVAFVPLFAPICGRLVDAFGARRVIIPGTVVYGLVLALFSQLQASRIELTLLFLFSGLGAFAATGAFPKIISSCFPERRGLALGLILGATAALASAVTVPLTGYIIHTWGWRTVYLVFAIGILAINLPVQIVFQQEPRSGVVNPHGASIGAPGLTRAEALRTATFWLLAGALVIDAFTFSAVRGQLVYIFKDRGLPPNMDLVVLSVMPIASLIGQIVMGFALDRSKSSKSVIAVFMLPFIGQGLLNFGPQNHTTIVIAAVFIGTAMGAELLLAPFLVGRLFGFRSFAEIEGFVRLFSAVALGLAPFAMGAWYEQFHSYNILLIIFQVALLAAVILVGFLGPYRFKRAEPEIAPDVVAPRQLYGAEV